DITGREIRKIITGNLPAGVNRISLNLTSFSSGVYFCVVKSGDISLASKKIVKLN
ncbi:MAG: T9SS type A sorting domain-containing protein, partial [Ignavibacteria bacterium]|nr:T9SS type A sorting domain-containing protein [Ignavibacteria bacterium]